MNLHRVNIDFEFELFDENYTPNAKKNKKFCEEFEFVYFFIEKNELNISTDRFYDSDYISYLKLILNKDIRLHSFLHEASPWWGDLTNKSIKKLTNSKETSFNVAKKLNLLPDGSYFIKDLSEIPTISPNEKYLTKSPYLMSGRGQQLYDSKQLPKIPFIIEPFHKVSRDFGIRMSFDKKVLSCVELENLNGKQFSGGRVISLSSEIDLNILSAIANEYQNMGSEDNIQIDCYSYENKIRYLVEANDRRTMGDFIYCLNERFSPGLKQGRLYVENSSYKTFQEMRTFLGENLYSPITKKGIIPCSPPGNLKTWLYKVE